MTVNSAPSRITYAGNGSTTQWPFSFSVDEASHISVFITSPVGSIVQLAPNQFQSIVAAPVPPNPTPAGGMIVYPVSGAPLAVGNFLTIVRTIPAVQDTSVANQSIIYPPVIEQEFDYLTMLAQGAVDDSSRAFKVPLGETAPMPVPSLGFRKNQQAVFDANGNLTAGGVVVQTIISAAMVPVVTAPTLPQARSAMGVAPIDSPAFTGFPTAPTPPFTDNDESVATTAFVQGVGATLGVLIPSGTNMLFHQTAAPTGWTKLVNHNDKALRVVNGTVGDGGNLLFSTVFGRTLSDYFVLTTAEMPQHAHVITDQVHKHGESGYFCINQDDDQVGVDAPGSVNQMYGVQNINRYFGAETNDAATGITTTVVAGESNGHRHGMDMRVLYVDVIIAQKN